MLFLLSIHSSKNNNNVSILSEIAAKFQKIEKTVLKTVQKACSLGLFALEIAQID